jgi:hypothetical protein
MYHLPYGRAIPAEMSWRFMSINFVTSFHGHENATLVLLGCYAYILVFIFLNVSGEYFVPTSALK